MLFGRLARWALLLQQYDFEIIHRPGCQNGNADALLRRPYPNTSLNALQQWFVVSSVSSDGLLYHLDRSQKRNARDSFSQLVVPQSMKYEILSNVHNHVAGAHFGVHKTFQKLKQRYWWPSMFKDVEHWCKSCVYCAMKSHQGTPKEPHLYHCLLKVPLTE